jgi:hypothetical protein
VLGAFLQKSFARSIIRASIAAIERQSPSIFSKTAASRYPQSRASSSHDWVSVASPSASSILLMKTALYRRLPHASEIIALVARKERRT